MDSIADAANAGKPQISGRSRLNFWIDLITAILFAALLGSGSLMKWILPPGTCDEDTLKLWLGHARHWWGDIHFWIAISMLVLLLVHIYLHWNWIRSLWSRLVGRGLSAQTAFLTVLIAGLLVIPFILPAEEITVESIQHEAGIETTNASTGAAPCGIEGLSCETCPASDDRLFGGGCGTDDETEAADPEVTKESPDCAECPGAAGCDSGTDCAGGEQPPIT